MMKGLIVNIKTVKISYNKMFKTLAKSLLWNTQDVVCIDCQMLHSVVRQIWNVIKNMKTNDYLTYMYI